MATTSPYLTPRESAVRMRYSYDHWRDLQARHLTPALRLGRKVLYTAEGLDKWAQSGGPAGTALKNKQRVA